LIVGRRSLEARGKERRFSLGKEKRIERMLSGDFQMSDCLPTHLSQMTAWMKNNLLGEFIKNMRPVISIMLLHVSDLNLANMMGGCGLDYRYVGLFCLFG
jgi:hypothetical protein